MASKSFQSPTGVTVWMAEPSGVSREIRLNAGEPYETDDKAEIAALQGSSEVEEVKSGGGGRKTEDDEPKDTSARKDEEADSVASRAPTTSSSRPTSHRRGKDD